MLMQKRKHTWKIIGTLVTTALFTASCSAHEVGGKSVEEVFKNMDARKIASLACNGKADDLQQALQTSNVNTKGLDGVTPLMWALTCRNTDGMRILLKAGADPNIAADNGSTTVTIAATYGESKFLKLLIENGGDKNAMENGRRSDSALVYALQLGANFDVWDNFDYLLAEGADLRTGNKYRPDETIANMAIGVYGRYCLVMKMIRDGYPVDTLSLYRTAEWRKVPKGELTFCRAELQDHLKEKFSNAEYQAYLKSKGWDKKK